jgi:hypothetical protein
MAETIAMTSTPQAIRIAMDETFDENSDEL